MQAMNARPLPRPRRALAPYPASWVAAILAMAVCTLPVLALLNARGVPASATLVGLGEALVFCLCVGVQLRRLSAWTLALGMGVFSAVVLGWLIRQSLDFKSLRDLLIPILFISLGRYVADARFAERCLLRITLLLAAVALFEAVFTDAYGELFNTFSFYARLGSIQESAAMSSGQTLTLNGFRPEDMGRTLLPLLLGSHRSSSLFLEPVSLGNYAAILLAWTLSYDWRAMGRPVRILMGLALLLIVLADSRFGMLMLVLMLAFRLLPTPAIKALAPALPLAILAVILAAAWLLPVGGDTVLGRITGSGLVLRQFDAGMLLGMDSALPDFGDMGFAYVLSRFGAPQLIALVLVLFLVPAASDRAQRFRALLVLYFFCSLAISGTSAFALKTAGLMWFLFGAVAADPGTPSPPLKVESQ